MKAIFTEQPADLVTFAISGNITTCRCLANPVPIATEETDENGQIIEKQAWEYDMGSFEYTEGAWLTRELILSKPETFVMLSGNVDKLAVKVIDQGQQYIDKWAQTRGYDNCHTASTYLNSEVPRFRAEAEILMNLRDQVWTIMQHLQAKAKQGDTEAVQQLFSLPAGLPEPDFSNVPEIV